MSEDISIINMSPCINLKVIESILINSKAVVIQAYGMGNLPTNNKKLLSLIKTAIEKDVVVIIKTQCSEGGVNDLYETGR
jgi:L-asparaginase/Glu-tRNA(Gln) amidotransferase subunit D